MSKALNHMLNPYFYASNPQLLAYENAWIDYIKNDVVPLETIISEDIFSSWKRCKSNNIDPLSREPAVLINSGELKSRIIKNKEVLTIAGKYMKTIYEMVRKTGAVVDFFDGDGYLIFQLCSLELEKLVAQTNTYLGCNLSEEKAGTNAVSLALKNKKAYQTTGAQNFVRMFQVWTYSAAPILDVSGNVLGVVSLAGNYESVHEHTLGMISAVASAVENELHIQSINSELKENVQQRKALLSMVTDGILYASNGIIKQVNQEMCKLIGCEEEDLIGHNLEEVLITTPHIDKILKQEGREYESRELVLEGKNKVYKCLFSVKRIETEDDIGVLLLVTRTDEIKSLAEQISNVAESTFEDIISVSPIMKEKIEMAKKAAMFGARVLIQGESGTGKEVLAQAIHNESSRKYNNFVAIDCGAIPRELFESEMFGYVKGAFTGAKGDGKIGLLELADKGTVFLDEVGNMPIDMQAKLLRVLQEGTISKVGSVEKIDIDIRVIAATNMDLKKAIEEGSFREDLYYRLNVMNIEIPPLKDRKEDIPVLLEHFLKKNLKKFGNSKRVKLASDAVDLLMDYEWPGNIRQLQNYAERLIIMSNGGTITKETLPYEIRNKERISEKSLQVHKYLSLEEMEKTYIKDVLEHHDNNISKAAEILGVSRATIYNKLKRHEDC